MHTQGGSGEAEARASRCSCLLGLDVGGSAVKVGLFDLDGRLRALQEAPIPVSTPHPGWAEVDPRRWSEAVVAGVRSVMSQSGVAPEQVLAVGLSNMIATVMPLDAEGRALRPAILYYDTRSAVEAAWMLDRAPEIGSVTGNRVLAGNTSLASILWVGRHEPETHAAAALYATVNTWLFRWLTGETRADWTNASFMGLFDYHHMTWSPELAAKLGFDVRYLAPVSAPHSAAPLSVLMASLLGLRPGTPVVLGGLDGAMSSLGVGAIHVGDAFDVSGTSEMVAVCLPGPAVCPELLGRWHVVPGLWTMIGAISTPGAAWQWFRNQLYAPGSRDDPQALYEAMTIEAAASPPGANGVSFLPHMMGERAPLWDPHARGVFFGLSLSTGRGDLLRAVLEGAAYAIRHVLEIIAERGGANVERVVSVGGATRNRLWLQIKADVWGVEIRVSPVREASALGAAMTAGVGAGLYADYDEAVRRTAAARDGGPVIVPDPARQSAYEHPYRVYRRLYPALAATMRFAAEG